jgi:NitT/TauT family transport system substrate-binding protein
MLTNRNERRLTAIKRLCCLPVAAAVSFAPSIPAIAQPAPVRLRLGSVANDMITPVLYGQAAGIFRDAGIDIDLQVINSGAAVAAAVAGGAIDLGRTSLFSVINAHARRVPLVLVAPSSISTADTASAGIMVRIDSPIHAAADLNGKIISAAALDDIFVVADRAWIDKNGGRSETVQFVELTGSQAGAALDAGRVDGAGVVNPNLARFLATGKYRSLADPLLGVAPRVLIDAWCGDTEYVRKNPVLVRTFANALAKASAYCNGHQQQTAALLAKFIGMDVETVLHMNRVRYALALDPRDIQPLIDAAAKYKVITSGFNARDIIALY